MAQEKPLDLSLVQAWLSAWNERDIFSDAAVRHLQSLITDPFCLVVVTLGVGREPRSLVFRRMKQMIPVLIPPLPALKPTVYAVQGDDGRWLMHTERRHGEEGIRWPADFPEMPVSPVPPVDPSVGQLWHQTGVKSETVPKRERVLRWDGTATWHQRMTVSEKPVLPILADITAKSPTGDLTFLVTKHGKTIHHKWIRQLVP